MAEYLIQDTTLDAIADAINAKTGGSSAMTPAEMVTAIGSISGGGGSGYAKKTGSFVLATDYVYETSLSQGVYSGSLLVDTGLSKICSIILWTDEWANKTMDSVNGVGCYSAINKPIPIAANTGYGPARYYPSFGVFKANTNYFYVYQDKGGIVLHSASADVPEGYFGFQVRSGTYPIKAGHTIRWEAVGEE